MNRYWVGGTGSWDATTTHWSASSGGASGASVPTSSDNAIFDANSGVGTVTIGVSSVNCLDLDFTNSSILTLTDASNIRTINVYGSLTFRSGMTLAGFIQFDFEATSTGKTITTAGLPFLNSVYFNGVGGGWTFLDNFTASGFNSIYSYNGTINTNGQTVTCFDFSFQGSGTKAVNIGSSTIDAGDIFGGFTANTTLNLGSGTINCYFFYGEITSINAGTSTINCFSGASSFYGGGFTYNNVNFTGTTDTGGVNTVDFHGSNTINALSISPKVKLTIDSSTTQTLGSFTATGTSGNLITLVASAAARYTLSKTSGRVSCNYLSLQKCIATGGATFYAGKNSTDAGNNSGWIFNLNNPIIQNVQSNRIA